MVDRGTLILFKTITRTRASRAIWSSVLLTVVAGLFWWGNTNWRTQAAAVTTLTLDAPAADLAATFQDEHGKGAVIAGFEGAFDPQSKQLTIQGGREITQRVAGGRTLNSRVDPNQEVPRNTAYTFTVANSTYLSTGDNAGNISGEIRLNNQSGATLYNTRVVFTQFRLCPASGACNGATAINPASYNYYNDGLIPYQGKLHVSRGYGDIPASGNSSAVWSFNVTTQPARFFFAFVVLSDWGVAAESVYPAAVQVNASSGGGVVIRGRGFTGTPTVSLLNAAGQSVGNLSNVAVTNDTQITATVPAGTAPGNYGVRVTLAGGTAGGQGSSVISGRLTVTGVPSANLSGSVSSLSGTGPFIVTSDLTLTSNVVVAPGTVFYVNNGARVLVASGAGVTANGGVPGVPNSDGVATPAQIVFTAQRSPGAAVPGIGAWGGVDATAAGLLCKLRNVVVE
ncbi:MAG: hypothetical protein HOP19_07130, partial [Acidobacteria bacterium]|nr:hypothetical protein [Acidobacteriota bacterium]